jgi:hypothetical protein
MMRINSGIICALSMSLAFAVACAESPGTGDDQTGDDTNTGNVCGDGTCATSEVGYCPTDCGDGNNNQNNAVCGNGQCETTKGESASTCFSDCGNGNNGSGSGSGNTSGTCPSDPNACIGCLLDPSQCPSGLDANSCLQCVLNGGGLGGSGLPGGSGLGSCEGGAPDGNCNAAAGEDTTTCPFDCQ